MHTIAPHNDLAFDLHEPAPAARRSWLPTLLVLLALPLLTVSTVRCIIWPALRETVAPAAASSERPAACPTFTASVPQAAVGRILPGSGIRSVSVISESGNIKKVLTRMEGEFSGVIATDLKDVTAEDLMRPAELQARREKLRADFNALIGVPLIKDVYIAIFPGA